MKLLIIEDEYDLAYGIKKGLELQEYVVDVALDGSIAIDMLISNQYDLVILDLNLPYVDGIKLLDMIREKDQFQKVLILSANTDVETKVEGLYKGANDYLEKPFYFKELSARIHALLRREFLTKESILMCKELTVDTKNKRISIADSRIEFSSTQYRIIEYLIKNKNRYVTTEELMEHVYDSEKDLFSNSIKVHINAIRKKMSQYTNSDLIRSTRGLGYIIEDTEK